ncbi:MAG: hypothetical protein OXP75_13370 [Rhodospirillales bacterium]|nr:hypothetical protein [Rhodospirillales bacterium]
MTSPRFRPHHALGLSAALIFALFPVFWMVSTSLKPLGEWAAVPPPWVPRDLTLGNYAPLFERYSESYVTAPRTGLGAILDSFIIAGGTTALALAIGLLAAIGFSRYRAGSDRLAIGILAVRAVPRRSRWRSRRSSSSPRWACGIRTSASSSSTPPSACPSHSGC